MNAVVAPSNSQVSKQLRQPPPDPHPPTPSRSGATGSIPYVLVAVLALTLLAGAVRLSGLAAPDGRLSKDEARLALSADGVLNSGLPVMPSGRVYTRGLLNGYLIAPSFALLGRHDFAARLPSALAGVLLVPVIFLLGRALGGAAAGLAAATFTALAAPLVDWSRSAWLPSVFLLFFMLAAYGCYRGFVERRGGWQVAGAAFFCLALLSYEFAVLLPAALGLYIGLLAVRGRRDWYRGRPTLIALGLLVGGLALFGSLSLALRAGTLAGPLGEARAFISPRPDLNGVAFYLRSLLSDYLVLIAALLMGLPLLARTRPDGTAFLGGLLALAFLVPSLVIQFQYQVRYALPVLPLLAVLAAAGTASLAALAGRRLAPTNRWRMALPGLVLSAVLGAALFHDLGAIGRLFRQPTPGPTWVQALQEHGLQPTDLIVTEGPEVVRFYLGRADFNFYTADNERYTYPAVDAVRSIYTDSALLHERGDFERLVERPNAGRTAWVLGRQERLQRLTQAIDPELWPTLARSAELMIETRDGWALVKLTLPRRSGPD